MSETEDSPEETPEAPPPEVEAEPFDPKADPGPTVDAPPSGEKAPEGSSTWPILCHLSPLIALLIPIPGVNVIAPLIVWQTQRTEPGVDDHGREAVNFQLNVLFWTVVLTLSCILSPLVFLVAAAAVVMPLIAAMQVSEGKRYRYPWILRVIQ